MCTDSPVLLPTRYPTINLESKIRSLKINRSRFKFTDLSLEHLVLVRTCFSIAPRGELCCTESHQLSDSRQFCSDSMTLFSVVYDRPRGCLPIGKSRGRMTEECRFALTLRVAEIERFARHREGITVERSADQRPDQGGDRITVTHEDGTAAVVLSEKEKCTSVGSTTSSGIKRHRMAALHPPAPRR